MRQTQLVEFFTVIDIGCGTNAIGSVAKVNFIGVEGEYLLLGQALFNFEGQQYLIKFSGKFLAIAEKEVARHLHGDGAATAAYCARGDQFACSSQQAGYGDSAMLKETVILGSKERIDHWLGDFVE